MTELAVSRGRFPRTLLQGASAGVWALVLAAGGLSACADSRGGPTEAAAAEQGATSSAALTGASAMECGDTTGLADTPSPMVGFCGTHIGRSPYVSTLDPAPAWQYSAGARVTTTPALGADGTLYFGDDGGDIHALNPDGTLKWRRDGVNRVRSSIAIGSPSAGGYLYYGSGDRTVYALSSADGSVVHSYQMNGVIQSSPVIGADGSVYIGSDDGTLTALNASLDFKWHAHMGSPVRTNPAIGQNGYVYVASKLGYLYAFDPSGWWPSWPRWQRYVGYGVESSPVVGADGSVYIGSPQGKVYRLNGNSGAVLGTFDAAADASCYWWMRCDVQATPAIGADGTVYVGADAEYFYALKPDLSTLKWRHHTGADMDGTPVVDANGDVIAGASNSNIYKFSGADGSVLWQHGVEAGVESGSVIGADGTVYVASNSTVSALGPGTWQSSVTCGDTGGLAGSAAPLADVCPTRSGHSMYLGPADGTIVQTASGNSSSSGGLALGWDGLRLIGTDSGLAAYDELGNRVWTYDAGSPIVGAAAVSADGIIHVADGVGTLHAIEPDGTFKWTFSTAGVGAGSPVISSDGSIYYSAQVALGDYRLHAVSRDGALRWVSPTSVGRLDLPATILANGNIAAASSNGTLVTLAADGTVRWSLDLGSPVITRIVADARDVVYVGTADGLLRAVSNSGSPQWDYNSGQGPIGTPALSGDGSLIIAGAAGVVQAVSTAGAARWTYAGTDAVVTAPVVATDGAIFVGTVSGAVVKLAGDGAHIWSAATNSSLQGRPVITSSGQLLVADTSGGIHVIGASAITAEAAPLPARVSDTTSPITLSATVDLRQVVGATDCGSGCDYYLEYQFRVAKTTGLGIRIFSGRREIAGPQQLVLSHAWDYRDWHGEEVSEADYLVTFRASLIRVVPQIGNQLRGGEGGRLSVEAMDHATLRLCAPWRQDCTSYKVDTRKQCDLVGCPGPITQPTTGNFECSATRQAHNQQSLQDPPQILGLDLGLPFEHEGNHYFTFGDAVFDNKPFGNNDAMARSTTTLASLRGGGCLDLDFPTTANGSALSPTTLGGPFSPPSGGAFFGDLYVPGPGFAVQGKMFVLTRDVRQTAGFAVTCSGAADTSCPGSNAECRQTDGVWVCYRTYMDEAGHPVPPASLIVPLLDGAYQHCDDDTDCEGFGVCRRRTLDGGSGSDWTSELFCHSAYNSAWDAAFDHTVDCGSDVLQPFPADNGVEPDGPFRDCVPVPRGGGTLGVVELDSIPAAGDPRGIEALRSISADEDPSDLLESVHGLGGSSFVTDPSDQRVWVFFDERTAGTHGHEPSPRLSTIEIGNHPVVGAYLDSKRYCSTPNAMTFDEACPVDAEWDDQRPLFDETVRQVLWRHVSVNPSASPGTRHRWLMVYGGHVPGFARSEMFTLRAPFKFANPALTDAVNDRADIAAVYLRTAPNPWGPWSRAIEIYNPYARPTNARDGFCYELHFDEGNTNAPVRLASGDNFSCGKLNDSVAAVLNATLSSTTARGADYGAGILGGFTRNTDRGTEFYWTVSTWVPYRVMLMKSTLSENDRPISGLQVALGDFLYRPDRFPPYGPVPPGPYRDGPVP